MVLLTIPKAPSCCKTKKTPGSQSLHPPSKEGDWNGLGNLASPRLCKLHTRLGAACWLCTRRLRCCTPFRPHRCLMKAEQQELLSGERALLICSFFCCFSFEFPWSYGSDLHRLGKVQKLEREKALPPQGRLLHFSPGSGVHASQRWCWMGLGNLWAAESPSGMWCSGNNEVLLRQAVNTTRFRCWGKTWRQPQSTWLPTASQAQGSLRESGSVKGTRKP